MVDLLVRCFRWSRLLGRAMASDYKPHRFGGCVSILLLAIWCGLLHTTLTAMLVPETSDLMVCHQQEAGMLPMSYNLCCKHRSYACSAFLGNNSCKPCPNATVSRVLPLDDSDVEKQSQQQKTNLMHCLLHTKLDKQKIDSFRNTTCMISVSRAMTFDETECDKQAQQQKTNLPHCSCTQNLTSKKPFLFEAKHTSHRADVIASFRSSALKPLLLPGQSA